MRLFVREHRPRRVLPPRRPPPPRAPRARGVLIALASFDHDRLWVGLGYRSLFDFLTRELGLPKGPAYYRMTAAGLVQKHPELVAPLRDGRLHLTSMVELSKVLTPENLADVLPRFFHTSKREAQEVRAALLPAEAPPMRTVVTSLPAPEPKAAAAGAPAAFTFGAVLPEEPRTCQLSVPDVVPPSRPRPQPTKVEPLTAELTRLHVTVSRRLLDKLAAARDALSHSHPAATEETILELGLDLIIERHRKRRGIGAKPRKTAPKGDAPLADAPSPSAAPSGAPAKDAPSPGDARCCGAPRGSAASRGSPTSSSPGSVAPPPPPGRSRHVPATVWRAVWERDGGKCAWPLERGGVCGSTRRLQLDHVDGFALGAGTTVEECRLACAFHNDLGARALYGDALMNRFTRPKRGPRCSEAVASYGPASVAVNVNVPWSRSWSWSSTSTSTDTSDAARVVSEPTVAVLGDRVPAMGRGA